VIADHPALSLAELESHDPNPAGHGAERRFLCPFPACADHQRREHKNLAANIETGLWECWRCGASGKLTEKWERRQPRERMMRLGPFEKARRAMGLTGTARDAAHHRQPGMVTHVASAHLPAATNTDKQNDNLDERAHDTVPTWGRRWDHAVRVAGTPGESYLASRGIPIDIATLAGVRYLERWEHWSRDERDNWRLEGTSQRVIFPILAKTGELIGIQGRKIADGEHGEKMLTNGRGGIFVAGTTWPVEVERVAIVEAPIDALSLAAIGIAALATQGTSWPDWLPLSLAFKKVLLAHDNDEPNADGQRAGDLAAASLVPALRSYGAEPKRYPPLSKDWNQDLQDLGLEHLRALVAGNGAAESASDEPAAQHDSAAHVVADMTPEKSVVAPTDEVACLDPVQVSEADRAEVVELLSWLKSADLPHERFQLRPWASVVDVARFAAMLEAELSSETIGPRWRAAAEDLKELARAYGGAAPRRHEAGLERAPPSTESDSSQPDPRVHVGIARGG